MTSIEGDNGIILTKAEEALTVLENAIRSGDKNAVSVALMDARSCCAAVDEVMGAMQGRTQGPEEPRLLLEALQIWRAQQQKQQLEKEEDGAMERREEMDDEEQTRKEVEERMGLVKRMRELEETLKSLQEARRLKELKEQEQKNDGKKTKKSGSEAVQEVVDRMQELNQQFEDSIEKISSETGSMT